MLKRQRTNYNPRVPSGMVAKTEKGYFYVKGDKRFRFISDRARESWNLKIVETTELAMTDCKVSGMIGFRDGTMIRDISTGLIYLITNNKRSLIVDPDDIKALGFRRDEIILVSRKEASLQQEGINYGR